MADLESRAVFNRQETDPCFLRYIRWVSIYKCRHSIKDGRRKGIKRRVILTSNLKVMCELSPGQVHTYPGTRTHLFMKMDPTVQCFVTWQNVEYTSELPFSWRHNVANWLATIQLTHYLFIIRHLTYFPIRRPTRSILEAKSGR